MASLGLRYTRTKLTNQCKTAQANIENGVQNPEVLSVDPRDITPVPFAHRPILERDSEVPVEDDDEIIVFKGRAKSRTSCEEGG